MRLRALLAASAVVVAGVIAPAAVAPASADVANSGAVRAWNANALAALGRGWPAAERCGAAHGYGAGRRLRRGELDRRRARALPCRSPGRVADRVDGCCGRHRCLSRAGRTRQGARAGASRRGPRHPPQPVQRGVGHRSPTARRRRRAWRPEPRRRSRCWRIATATAATCRSRSPSARSPASGGPSHRRTVIDPNSWISEVDPFTLLSTSQFRTPGPRNLNSAAYAHEYNEVKDLGAVNSPRNAEQDAIARFFNVNPLELLNRTFRGISQTEGLSLVEDARLFGDDQRRPARTPSSTAGTRSGSTPSGGRPPPSARVTTTATRGRSATQSWTSLEATPPYSDHTSGYNCMAGSLMNAGKAFFGVDQMDFSVVRMQPNVANVTARVPPPHRRRRRHHRCPGVPGPPLPLGRRPGRPARSAGCRVGRRPRLPTRRPVAISAALCGHLRSRPTVPM